MKIENYALDMASSLRENQTVEVKKAELSKLITETLERGGLNKK